MLQKETGTTALIDPWGGSDFVERLTHDLAARAMGHIEEVEALGGMAAAIERGIPQAADRGSGGAHPGAHRFRRAGAWSASTLTGPTADARSTC